MKMSWSRAHTLAAGAALIVLTNAIALGGVFANRSGEPESRVTLTERELPLSYETLSRRENSGLALRLDWRVLDADDEYGGFGYPGYRQPAWFDANRMAALGFAIPAGGEAGAGLSAEARRRFTRQLPRQVLVVLEFDGPAWRQALARAQAASERHAAAAAANPASREFAERAKRAREHLADEQAGRSRLFAVDAGLDGPALRARYPDRGRQLILRAVVRPSESGGDKRQPRLGGYVSEIAIGHVNVPYALRPPLLALRDAPPARAEDRPPRYQVHLATGRRLEPWIESVAPLSAAPAR